MQNCLQFMQRWKYVQINPLKTSPEYTRAGVNGKCVLWQNQIVFNGLMEFGVQQYLESFEMWLRRKMEMIKWSERVN